LLFTASAEDRSAIKSLQSIDNQLVIT